MGKYEPASVRDPAGSRMTKARKVADEIRREIIALADLQDAQDELAAALCRACAHRVGGRCDFDSMRLFGLVEMVLFIVTVFIAYAYVWRRGGLDWD